MKTKPARTCNTLGCLRPARARGLCSAHYRAERRRGPVAPEKTLVGPSTRPPKIGGSDLHFVNKSGPLSQIAEVEIDGRRVRVRYSEQGQPYIYIDSEIFRAVEGGKLAQEFQVPGVVCSECRDRTLITWCDSPEHPIFLGKWEPTWSAPKPKAPRAEPPKPDSDVLHFCGSCERWAARTNCLKCGEPTTENHR
jgi:hypothetical protein